jgi:DNA-binding NtrC family response regulator
LDLGLGDMSGMHVLAHMRAKDADATVVVITAEKRIDTAVAAMRAGAYDYLTKPLDRERLVAAVKRAHERRIMAVRLRTLSTQLDERGTIIGQSDVTRAMMEQVSRVMDSDVAVCVLGESGCGKELIARAIHKSGRRRNGAFVAINCAAIPESLQESELFGHEKGAFTGATASKPGRFEQAHHGTLFLDEIGEMSAATQAAMLRALQERVVRRVGGTSEIPVDVRIVCATHRDLEAEVRAGRFREDLYFRLVVYPIRVPALRERQDDIPLLVAHFLKKLGSDVGRVISRVSSDAMSALLTYRWPGNVRELENVVHRAMLACDTDEIVLAHLPPSVRQNVLPELPASASSGVSLGDGNEESQVIPLRELEKRAIERALRIANGSVGKAAKLLGMGRATLYRRLAELGDEIKKTG